MPSPTTPSQGSINAATCWELGHPRRDYPKSQLAAFSADIEGCLARGVEFRAIVWTRRGVRDCTHSQDWQISQEPPLDKPVFKLGPRNSRAKVLAKVEEAMVGLGVADRVWVISKIKGVY